MMRAVTYTEYGEPAVLDIESVERPTPRDHEILVETKAIGINPTDAVSRRGERPTQEGDAPPRPSTLGADFAGIVINTGQAVTGVDPGDRVFGTGLQTARHGSYAEYTVAPETNVARLPDCISFETGGAMGVVGVTAWQGLVEYAGLKPGETCLVHGGSGGVGHVAVQLAGIVGATVVATAGDSESRTAVAELGASAVVDYRRDDLEAAIRTATEGGIDVVLDHRLGVYLPMDAELGASRVIGIGGPEDTCQLPDLWSALQNDLTLQVFSMSNIPVLREPLQRIARLMAAGDLTVFVSRKYSLANAAEAHRALEAEHFFGKAILVP